MASQESPFERAYILEVLGGASQGPKEIPVFGAVKIGRRSADLKVDVSIPDECVSASRQHAVMDLRGERPTLEDQSRYGTIVNGKRLGHGLMELSDGDEIIFGMPGDGWRVRFRYANDRDKTKPADPLELLTVSEKPRLVSMGPHIIEENLGRDAFLLLKILSENKGRWYTTDHLVDLVWQDPDRMPIAAKGALSKAKRKVNDLLRPHLYGQEAITKVPYKGYQMKPRLDVTQDELLGKR